MASTLQTILSTVKTKLEAITAGVTYQTTVVSVSDVYDPPQEKDSATGFPYVWFGDMTVKGEGSDANLHHTEEEVAIDLHLEVAYTTAAAARPAIMNLYSDVKVALNAQWNLGLTAVKDAGVDLLRVGAIQGETVGFISGICTFHFSYRHVYGDPTTGA